MGFSINDLEQRKNEIQNQYKLELENLREIYTEEINAINEHIKKTDKIKKDINNIQKQISSINKLGKYISQKTLEKKEKLEKQEVQLDNELSKINREFNENRTINDVGYDVDLLKEKIDGIDLILKSIDVMNITHENDNTKEEQVNDNNLENNGKTPNTLGDKKINPLDLEHYQNKDVPFIELTDEQIAQMDSIRAGLKPQTQQISKEPTNSNEKARENIVNLLLEQEKDNQPMQPSTPSMMDDIYTNNVDQVQPKSILSQNNNENKYTSLANLMFQQEEKKVDGNQQNDNPQKKNQTLDSQQIAQMDEILGKTPTSLSHNNTTAPDTGDYGNDIFDILKNFDSGEPSLQGQDKPVPDEELNRILFGGSTGIDSTMPVNIPPIVKQEETPIQETDKIKPIAKKVKRKVPINKDHQRKKGLLKRAKDYFTQYDEETDYEINLGMERGDEMYGRRKGL